MQEDANLNSVLNILVFLILLSITLIFVANSGYHLLIQPTYVGSLDPQHVLKQMELQIASAKEEAFSRKEILEKVEKWFVARDEECWLEEYNRVELY